jgi:hypothetical protein
MTFHNLPAQSTNSPTGSLTVQSASTIQTAIRSPFDEGATLKRVNAILANYYDPDFDAETKALARGEFLVALKGFPDWAVQRAFDSWVKTATRRPSPGEIAILASRALKPLSDELALRAKERAAQDEYKREAERAPHCKEMAERIMQTNGFTAKRFGDIKKRPMANTWADVDAVSDPAPAPLHWSVGKVDDSPEMAALRAARAANPLMNPSGVKQ